MSSNQESVSVAGYPRYKGVNHNRKSRVEPRRRFAGVFVTFRQLQHSLLFALDRASQDERVKLDLRILHFKQSQAQLINQHLSHPITSSHVATGKQRSDRCRYTGSRSRSPAHRQYGRSLLTRAEVMIGSRLSAWGDLSRTAVLTPASWETGLKRCPKYCLLYFILDGLLQSAKTSLNAVEIRKQKNIAAYLLGRHK